MRYAHSLGSMSSAKMDGKLKKPLDYINIVLQIIEHLLSWNGPEDEVTITMPYLVIETNKKVQRAYIVKNSQIVSFAFPFHVYEKLDVVSGVRQWHVRHKVVDVTSVILSKCRTLYVDYINHKEILSFREIASAQNLSDPNVLLGIRLFECLMLAEPAYVRYDYDPIAARGLIHPMCHFDYNFIEEHHYKIGLHSRVNLLQIEDMINKDTDCWYVGTYKESVHDKQQRLKERFSFVKKKRSRIH